MKAVGAVGRGFGSSGWHSLGGWPNSDDDTLNNLEGNTSKDLEVKADMKHGPRHRRWQARRRLRGPMLLPDSGGCNSRQGLYSLACACGASLEAVSHKGHR